MSYDPRHTQAAVRADGAVIDAGLQGFMRGVYNRMTMGLAFTGLTAFAVANTPALLEILFANAIMGYIVIFAPLAFILFGFTPGRMARWPAAKLQGLFYVFSGLMGLSMSTIFLTYTAESITQVFFITAATFAGMSLFGYTTKRDLTGVGSFMVMGLWGIVIASIVNIFMQSGALGFAVSMIGVLVFTGLTAWETQRLKEVYLSGQGDADAMDKVAVMGALSLYLSFINLFQSLLHLLGNRE